MDGGNDLGCVRSATLTAATKKFARRCRFPEAKFVKSMPGR
jgi:hypothetical protein